MEGNKYHFFSQTDFDKANPPCSMDTMDRDFMLRIEAARIIAGIPFIVTSAFRTVDHELSRGRNGTSSHTKGLALDIRAMNDRERFIIVDALRRVGFNRTWIYRDRNFIHVDMDKSKDQNLLG